MKDNRRNIDPPFVTDDDPDRHVRCEDAIHSAIRALLEDAVRAGWSETETLRAIQSLASSILSERRGGSKAMRNVVPLRRG